MAWKKHERARKLMEAIGPYLYGTAALPKPLNDLFLRWIETHDVPTYREIRDALRKLPSNGGVQAPCAASCARSPGTKC